MNNEGDSAGNEGCPGAKPPAQRDGNPAPAVVAIRMEDIAHWAIERVAKARV
jgi:hypothetical protein